MFKTQAVVKLELLEQPTTEQISAAKASLTTAKTQLKQHEFIKFASENKQEDLQYFKAVYATCGFNLNDDVFIKDEFWKARTTPIWKPTNWNHTSDDIIGVIYAVQAQKLDGSSLDIENSTTPTDDFELVVYGVIYKYIFNDYAKTIKQRSDAGSLYVSMESWFSDFSYAILDSAKSTIQIVERNQDTVRLDQNLRAFGGDGKYDGKRIGRVLKNITFGGMGIVEKPANPRSSATTAKLETEMEKIELSVKDLETVKPLVEAAAKVPVLEKELAVAKENETRVAKREAELEKGKAVAETVIKALEDFDLVKAGLTTSTPVEITRIDNASDKFAAKLAFITQTGSAFSAKAAEAVKTIAEKDKIIAEKDALIVELEKIKAEWLAAKAAAEKAKAEAEKAAQDTARLAEVKALNFDDKVIESLKATSKFLELDKDAYNKWLEEKKVIAASIPLRHDGGQGSPTEEGKSGESKVKSGPRFKITAELLRNAKVEETVELSEEDKKSTSGLFSRLLVKDTPKNGK